MKIAGLKCFVCEKEFKLSDTKYVCPACGGNLDVLYEYSHIKKLLSHHSLKNNTNFSIWRYSPVLPVNVSSSRLPTLTIGWTPLLKAQNLSKKIGIEHLYFKDDTKLPSASFKDRASSVVVVYGQSIGVKTYTTASTGNAGCALACVCANLALPCVIIVPETAPKAKIAQLLIFGAKVIAVKGSYDDAFDLSLKASVEFGWYCRSTGYNPFTREGKKTAALEICEQLNWKAPDKVFVPVGDGNIISGIWKGFRDFYAMGFIDKLPQLIGVQSELSNAIAKAVIKYEKEIYTKKHEEPERKPKIKIEPVRATTIADSISVNMPRDGIAAVKAITESKGFVIEVSDEEILEAIKTLSQQEGLFPEPAGAASFAGLVKLLIRGKINRDEKIVCLVTGNGLKDISSAMRVAGEPVTITPTLDALRKAIDR
ncbi:MAG: threonine synthase [Elusimicrobiota bacterium]